MSRGRRVIADTVNTIEGDYALSVGDTEMPAPPGWRWMRLADAARLESGHTPSRQHAEYWDGPIPWIGLPDAREHHGSRIRDTSQRVTQAGIDNSAARVLPMGTVCLSRTASIGYVTVMDRPMATSQDFVNWVCGPEIDPDFLMYLLVAEKGALRRFSKGSTHSTIYFPEVQAFRVCAPERDEQRRIVARLDALRARSRCAKDSLDAVPALLDRLRQSILAAAFRGDLTADWRDQHADVEPATELLKRIRIERRKRWEEAELAKLVAKGKPPKDDRWKAKYVEPEPVDETDLPELPNNWCWATVDQLSLCLDGVRVPLKQADRDARDGPYPYYGASGIIDALDDYLFDGSYLLVAEDGANLLSRSTPIAFDADGRFWVNNHAHVLHPIVPRAYLREALNALDLSPSVTGSAQPKLTQAALLRLPLALAPSMEQSVIVDAVAAMRGCEARLGAEAERTGTAILALDAAILTAAFRGELLDRQSDRPPAVTGERP